MATQSVATQKNDPLATAFAKAMRLSMDERKELVKYLHAANEWDLDFTSASVIRGGNESLRAVFGPRRK
ncbi:MAG: hypothetical protein EOP50_17510 [Sphingobacteriales bacterium]|nr:MAG: hypothetical protein EOP50_17510 [Sphingobacteriales bacterium]